MDTPAVPSWRRFLDHSNAENRRELRLQFKLVKQFVRGFENSGKWYSTCIVTNIAVPCQQLLAIATTAGGQVGLAYIYSGLLNVFSFALLMHVGNSVKTEVSP